VRLRDRPWHLGRARLSDPGRVQLERAQAAPLGWHHRPARPVAVPPVGAALRGRLVPAARCPHRRGRALTEGRPAVIRLPLVLFFSAVLFSTGVYGVLARRNAVRSEEHTSELQSRVDLVCRLLLEKKKEYASA